MKHDSSPSPRAGSRIVTNLSLVHGVTANTKILTCCGEKPAAHLKTSDRIITRDHGALPLVATITRTPKTPQYMVHIPANAFGVGRPACDMDVLPDQPIVVRDWRAMVLYGHKQARVAASRLIDGRVISGCAREAEAMIALHFAAPSVIHANGLELLSAGMCLDPVPDQNPSGF